MALIVPKGLDHQILKQHHSHQIGPGHQGHADVRHVPSYLRRDKAGEKDDHRADDPADEHCRLAEGVVPHEIADVCLNHKAEGHQGGKRKEQDRNSHKHGAGAGNQGVDGRLHIGGPHAHAGQIFGDHGSGGLLDHIIAASGENHQCGGSTDENRHYIDREGLRKALLHRVGYLSSGGCVGTLAGARVAGIQGALDAPHDSAADQAAIDRIHSKGGTENQPKHGRNLGSIEYQNDQSQDNVGDPHKGNQHAGHSSDPLDTPKGDHSEQNCDGCANHYIVNSKGRVHGVRNVKGLHRGAGNHGSNDGDHRVKHAQGNP